MQPGAWAPLRPFAGARGWLASVPWGMGQGMKGQGNSTGRRGMQEMRRGGGGGGGGCHRRRSKALCVCGVGCVKGSKGGLSEMLRHLGGGVWGVTMWGIVRTSRGGRESNGMDGQGG